MLREVGLNNLYVIKPVQKSITKTTSLKTTDDTAVSRDVEWRRSKSANTSTATPTLPSGGRVTTYRSRVTFGEMTLSLDQPLPNTKLGPQKLIFRTAHSLAPCLTPQIYTGRLTCNDLSLVRNQCHFV